MVNLSVITNTCCVFKKGCKTYFRAVKGAAKRGTFFLQENHDKTQSCMMKRPQIGLGPMCHTCNLSAFNFFSVSEVPITFFVRGAEFGFLGHH